MKSPDLGWLRSFIRFKTQSDKNALGEFVRLLTTEAMANRVALNGSALHIYNEMLDVDRHGDSEKAGEKAGGFAYKLIATLAAESGKKVPKTPKEIVHFPKLELKGFDTPEATELAAGARLAAIKDLLSGREK
jgi:hypothetical protein